MQLVFLVQQNYISILTQINANQAYQISVSKNKTSIFGELFHLMFRDLYDNWSKIIGDEFLIFDCMDI
jgi:hypothetical protein